ESQKKRNRGGVSRFPVAPEIDPCRQGGDSDVNNHVLRKKNRTQLQVPIHVPAQIYDCEQEKRCSQENDATRRTPPGRGEVQMQPLNAHKKNKYSLARRSKSLAAEVKAG